MKKILCLFLILCFLFGTVGCSVPSEPIKSNENSLTDGNILYQYIDDKLYAAKYYGKDTKLTVPSSFEGNKVYGILAVCFGKNSEIKSITIEDGIEDIAAAAFKDCSSLGYVRLPEGITEIKNETFTNCTSLTVVNIPDSVTVIGNSAFLNCKSFSKLEFNDNLKMIDTMAFYNSSVDWVIFPEGFEVLGVKAFGNCGNLKRTEFLDHNTTISDDAFTGSGTLICGKLKSTAQYFAEKNDFEFVEI